MKKRMKCVECGGPAGKVNDIEFSVDVQDKEVLITNLIGYRCTQCGAEYHSPETVEKVQEILTGIKKAPKVQFSRKLTRSGKRWVIGIPNELMDALGLEGGEETRIHLAGRKIVAEFESTTRR
jgi:YgiT-type zinc finger domain-containing protein